MIIDTEILVLGVGNPLAGDDGVGPEIIRRLNESFTFSDRVIIIDAGSNILAFLEQIATAEKLLIADAIIEPAEPGTIIVRSSVECSLPESSGQHQIGIEELLLKIETLCGRKPQTTIVGVVPQEITAWSDKLSEPVQSAIPRAIEEIIRQLQNWGFHPLSDKLSE
jgi:hydrogenase maturation protease